MALTRARHRARPVLLAVSFVTTVVGGYVAYVSTRPDATQVTFVTDALAAADAPVIPPDTTPDTPPVDSATDATAPSSMSEPWPRWAILSESTGSTLVGADGVAAVDLNGDDKLDLTAAWEQSGRSTVSINPGCASAKSAWSSVTMPVATVGVEDSTFGDVDGDGRQDVISSGSSGLRVYVHFAPTLNADLLTAAQWTGITITSSINVQRFLKTLVFDTDSDGHPDIVAGGYSTGASLDIYRSTTPRTAASWTRETIGVAGAIYSLEKRDMDGDGDQDLVLTDRDGVGVLKGARWMRNPATGGGSWTSHSIYQIGNSRWLSISSDGKTIVMGTSSTVQPSFTYILTCAESLPSGCNPVGGSAPAWQRTTVTEPSNAGLYNQGKLYDVDGDGDDDLVIVYHHAYGDLSNVLWLRNDGSNTWTRGEISGVEGVKSDNFELLDLDCDGDLDVVTTDEGVRGDSAVTPLGITWHENRWRVP
jgi:hypothetical protein